MSIPASSAARNFDGMPPTGPSAPEGNTVPVMVTFWDNGPELCRLVSTPAVRTAPAEGPSMLSSSLYDTVSPRGSTLESIEPTVAAVHAAVCHCSPARPAADISTANPACVALLVATSAFVTPKAVRPPLVPSQRICTWVLLAAPPPHPAVAMSAAAAHAAGTATRSRADTAGASGRRTVVARPSVDLRTIASGSTNVAPP